MTTENGFTNKTAGLVVAAGVGAGLMYFFDPNRGRARRNMVRDRATKLYKGSVNAIEHTVGDLENRINGIAHEAEALLHPEPIDDDVLVARIRAKLGHLVAHPHQITVAAKDGHVTLTGHIQANEALNLVLSIRAMHGVKGVDNKLETTEKASGASKRLPRVVAEIATLAGVSSLFFIR